MAKLQEVLQYMQLLAPEALAEEWDNVGLLVDCGADVTSILVALDITEEVVSEAEYQGCQLIVSHHPVIFDPIKNLGRRDVVFRMVKKNISAICMHTNLDAASGGVNDILCALFGIENARTFGGLGRVGAVRTTNVDKLAAICRDTLGAHVKAVDCGTAVNTLAVVGGAGGSMLQDAVKAGADCLLTGEANHHVAIDARQKGISLIVAGHYATEFPVVPVLGEKLKKQFPGVRVLCSRRNKDPFIYL